MVLRHDTWGFFVTSNWLVASGGPAGGDLSIATHGPAAVTAACCSLCAAWPVGSWNHSFFSLLALGRWLQNLGRLQRFVADFVRWLL